jgi:hypothetical protein
MRTGISVLTFGEIERGRHDGEHPSYSRRLADQGHITVHRWDLYDTRHTVFRPAQLSPDELERGYWRAYRDFYRWGSIVRGATAHRHAAAGLGHLAYAAGWKKFEPLWDVVIRAKRAGMMLPVLETILSEFGGRRADCSGRGPTSDRAAGSRLPRTFYNLSD